MYSFERGFVPTLHYQLLPHIFGWSTVESECLTRVSTISPQLDGAVTKKRCYTGFICECEEPSVGEFHPLINELVKACNISFVVNSFYNGSKDIVFFQEY